MVGCSLRAPPHVPRLKHCARPAPSIIAAVLDGLPADASAAVIIAVNLGLPLLSLIVGIYLWCKRRDELSELLLKELRDDVLEWKQ